jgi:ABC-type branched-subunit amino acid transport system permease subunit
MPSMRSPSKMISPCVTVLVGFTGQISIEHAAFFLFGAFSSAHLSNNLPAGAVRR